MAKTILVVGFGPGISTAVECLRRQRGRRSPEGRRGSHGVYVGEVMVAGTVKGTAWDKGAATLDPATIANKFRELHQARGEIRARLS